MHAEPDEQEQEQEVVGVEQVEASLHSSVVGASCQVPTPPLPTNKLTRAHKREPSSVTSTQLGAFVC